MTGSMFVRPLLDINIHVNQNVSYWYCMLKVLNGRNKEFLDSTDTDSMPFIDAASRLNYRFFSPTECTLIK